MYGCLGTGAMAWTEKENKQKKKKDYDLCTTINRHIIRYSKGIHVYACVALIV